LAALQKQQEDLRKRQEEEARIAAEDKAREEEEARREEEEERARAEAKAAKKQREKEKIEQLKKEGKYQTEAQRKAAAIAKARMDAMIASGAVIAGLNEDGGAKKKSKPVYDTKKKKAPTKKELEEKKLAEEEAAEIAGQAKRLEDLKLAEEQKALLEAETAKAKADAEAKKPEEGEVLEDWEAVADADGDDLKDSWDADSDEDESPAKTAVNGKPVQAGSVAKPAQVVTNGKGIANGRQAAGSDSSSEEDDSSDEDSSEDEETTAAKKAAAQKKALAIKQREERHQQALAARSKENLRSPICCILGHVDTGKTKLLDKIRQTNVQEGEAGGITQQIGATYFPVEALQKKTHVVNEDGSFVFNVPGLLVIDTPGHESFTNLRSRGSSLCNIAILVVDIMHGLEPQTLESMRLLRDRKTPFIVALNKIDRLYGWSRIDNNGFQDSLAMQKKSVQAEFERRVEETKLAFAEQGFNSELFYENKNLAKNVSLVPTSAHTGEGIPDMLKLIIKLTQERMTGALMYLSEVEATILEVKVIEGLGTTIDVILSNGVLREGDRIVLCGLNGPIATNIRALLTPAEMKELRVKSQYVHNKEVKAALGVKISANDLEHAIAGSRLLVVGPEDDEEDLEEEVMGDLENLLGKVSTTGRGVSVQASTLGSLEALLEFLRVSKIPVANISIGPVYKRDVMQAGAMLEKSKQYAVMLCFDVKVDKDAQLYADEVGVKIFTADIIYHLFDDFTKHMAQIAEQKKEESKLLAVFPCVLKPVAVFNKTEPIVIGVDVVEGNLRLLTPLAAVRTNAAGAKEIVAIGRV
jgi:translation initiation factor 5B